MLSKDSNLFCNNGKSVILARYCQTACLSIDLYLSACLMTSICDCQSIPIHYIFFGLKQKCATWQCTQAYFSGWLSRFIEPQDVYYLFLSQDEERPKSTMYSPETGRLIPPPSRAMSRGFSRRGQRERYLGHLQHIAAEPDMETVVSKKYILMIMK